MDACKLALEECLAACTAGTSTVGKLPAPEKSVEFVILHKDLLSLFALLRASTTKISLALNPSRPEYSAALPSIKDAGSQIAAIIHCSSLFSTPACGQTLVAHVHRSCIAILETTRELALHFLRAINGQTSDQEAYLRLTGSVHQALDDATATIPRDNRAAVYIQWSEHKALCKDASSEVDDAISSASQDTEAGKDDDEFDDLDLGLDLSVQLSASQAERSRKIHAVLRLLCAMLARVSNEFLLPSSVDSPNTFLDPMVTFSSSFSSSADDLAAFIYPPHSVEELISHLENLQKHVDKFNQHVLGFSDTVPVPEQTRKWFVACFAQLSKAISSAHE